MPLASFRKTLCTLLTPLLLGGCVASGFSTPPEHLLRPGEEHLVQGKEYERRGEWEQAEQAYTEATQYTGKGYVALGELYAARGNLVDAEGMYRMAMRTIRDDAVLYCSLAALLLEQREDLEEAEELAELSVKIADQKQFPISWDTLNAIRQARKEAIQ